MKRRLIILDGFLLLLIVAFGFALYHSIQIEKNHEHNTSYQGQEESKSEKESSDIEILSDELKINVEKLKNEDFQVLSGLWKNRAKIGNTKELVISGPLATIDGIHYDLAFGGVNHEDGLPYLNLRKNGEITDLVISIYPQNTFIPVVQADGSIDRTGVHDPTDHTKERLLMRRETLTAGELVNQVLYREMEEAA